MPLPSATLIRRWLTPWAIAPLALLVPIFVNATPPTDLWAPMILWMLAVFLVAGALAGMAWAALISALTIPPTSPRRLAFGALAGAIVPFAPVGAWVGSVATSILVFAALGAIAAWRVAPSVGTEHVARVAARTT